MSSAAHIGIVAIVAALTGVVLLWLGLRGRRTGDHPFCRRCGFDLFGKPDDADNCSECGAALIGPRSYLIGVRHRRPWAIGLGILILLPLCGVAGIVALGTYRGVNWNTY